MGITLREWSQQWLEVYVKPVAKPSGYEHYYDNMYKHILPKLGDVPLKSLTTAVVQHFLNEESLHGNLRTGGALSAKSIKNMRVVLDVCCKRAVADGMMPANPVPATVYTHCRSKKHNIMSDSNQKVLEKWLFSDLSLNNAGIILALYSGMRLGEVCAARWGNYDAMSGTLHITQTVRRVMVDLRQSTASGRNLSSALRKAMLLSEICICRKYCRVCLLYSISGSNLFLSARRMLMISSSIIQSVV